MLGRRHGEAAVGPVLACVEPTSRCEGYTLRERVGDAAAPGRLERSLFCWEPRVFAREARSTRGYHLLSLRDIWRVRWRPATSFVSSERLESAMEARDIVCLFGTFGDWAFGVWTGSDLLRIHASQRPALFGNADALSYGAANSSQPQSFGVSWASLGTSLTMAVALLVQ